MNVLDLAVELINRRSITPDDAGCQELIADLLERAGFRIERMMFGNVANLWATHGSGAPLICLAGHTDVVPPGPAERWSSPPFEANVREGVLYGRGASDMKASVAAMVLASKEVAQNGHSGTVALLLTSDEEGPGINGTPRALHSLLSRGISIDGAIVGEPTCEERFGDIVKSGRRGSMTGRLRIVGKQGHTAYPQKARNAVHLLAPVLSDLIAIEWGPPAPGFPPTSLQISNLAAGTGANNVIPGECDLEFNIRYGPSNSTENMQSRIESLLVRHGVEQEVEWSVSAIPFVTEPGPLLESLEDSIFETTGIYPNRSNGGGTSDARFFAEHGIPVAEFGPLNDSIHAIDEHVAVDCLEPLVQVYRRTLEKLLS